MADQATRIVRITAPEINLMAGFFKVFADAFEDENHYLGSAPSVNYMQKILAKPHVISLAYIEQGLVVGGMIAYLLDKLEAERSEVYLYDIAVKPEYQRRGIASAMIDALIEVARSLGAHLVYVQADGDDLAANALYTARSKRANVAHYEFPVVQNSRI